MVRVAVGVPARLDRLLMLSRRRRRQLAIGAGLAMSVGVPGSALAGWNPTPLPRTGFEQFSVVAGVPGRAAVVGASTETGAVVAAVHQPGAGWGDVPVVADSADLLATRLGSAGAVATNYPDRVELRSVSADGSVTGGPVPGISFARVLDVAGAAGGSALVAAQVPGQAVSLGRLANGGVQSIGTVNVGDATTVAVRSTAPDQYVVIWSEQQETDDDDAPAVTSLYARVIDGSRIGPRQTLASVEDTTFGGAEGDDFAATQVGGRVQVAWAQDDGSARTIATRANGGGTAVLGTTAGSIEDLRITAAYGQAFASWQEVDDDGNTSASKLARLSGGVATPCPSPGPFVSGGLVARPDGSLTFAGSASGAFGVAAVAADCRVTAPVAGPLTGTAPGASAAAADQEGTLVVTSEADSDAPASVGIFDLVPPSLATSVPQRVGARERTTVTATAQDSWSPVTVNWTLDSGTPVSGAAFQLPEMTPGEHGLRTSASDVAGNIASTTSTFTALGTAPPVPETPTPVAAPPAAPEPSSAPPPATTPGTPPTTKRPLPSVRAGAVGRTRRGFAVPVTVRGATKVRVTMYREVYEPGGPQTRAVRPCAAFGAGGRGPVGLVRRVNLKLPDGKSVLVLPRAFQQSLVRRGRYTLRLLASSGPRRSAASPTRFTIC